VDDDDAIGLADLLAVALDLRRQRRVLGQFRRWHDRVETLRIEIVEMACVAIRLQDRHRRGADRVVETAGSGMAEDEGNLHDTSRSIGSIIPTPGDFRKSGRVSCTIPASSRVFSGGGSGLSPARSGHRPDGTGPRSAVNYP